MGGSCFQYTRTAYFLHEVACKEVVATLFPREDVRDCIANLARFLCGGEKRETLREVAGAKTRKHISGACFSQAFVDVHDERVRAGKYLGGESLFYYYVPAFEKRANVTVLFQRSPFSV